MCRLKRRECYTKNDLTYKSIDGYNFFWLHYFFYNFWTTNLIRMPQHWPQKWLHYKLFIDCSYENVIETRVSNGMGQRKFLGQRDRNLFLVPGQRDNGTSSKFGHGTGRDFDSLSPPVLGRPAGQKWKKKHW